MLYVRSVSGTVTLREISSENGAAVRELRVSPAQEVFVASVAESLDEAAASPEAHPWYRAIYADDQPVGFVMLGFNMPPGHPDYPWRYFLWRLLIDARHQRRGYGRAAMALVIDIVRSSPGGTVLVTSVQPGDGGPAPFYRSLGFEATGEWFDGQEVYRLEFRPVT